MTRVRPPLLLLLAACLLALWVGTPLLSSPPQVAVTPAEVAEATPLPVPELQEINREVDRLRERLAEPARAVAPGRDPFQFAEPPAARSRATDLAHADADPSPVRDAAAPVIRWPTLVAMLSSGDEATPTRRVVLGDALGLVHVRAIGETYGDITISAITAEDVTLVHEPSGSSTRLALD